MGIGDEIMLAGEAKRRAAGKSVKFRMLDKRGAVRWHFVWDYTEHVARPGEPFAGEIGFSSGRRPYCESVTPAKYTWRVYQPEPALMRLPDRALKLAEESRGAVVFNPAIKHKASPNKQWSMDYWRQIVESRRDIRWLQIGEPGGFRLRGAEWRPTADFIDACGLLSGARAAVLHEGALHHAAAALNVPAIVLFGGFIGPMVTGYEAQHSLFIETEQHPIGCGYRVQCYHCEECMKKITPGIVSAALTDLLRQNRTVGRG